MTTQAETEQPEEENAYSLLTADPLDLSDRQIDIVIADLRRRRKNFKNTGKADNPAKKAKAKAQPTSAAEKKANTDALLDRMNLKI